MSLSRLGISHLRNIQDASLELDPRVNVFYGQNGSGKTSLLESVYFLGSGRTFRSPSADPLINHNSGECTVFGVVDDEDGRATRLGVRRGRDGSRDIRINGESVARASLLARQIPTLVLGPHTVELVTGTPAERRRFLNWGVFHVEQRFGDLWDQLVRCLRQRNSLLKRGNVSSAELSSWNARLVSLAIEVDDLRAGYFTQFHEYFTRVASALMGEKSAECRYYRGWESGRDLAEILAEQEDSDRRRGFTQIGPHRADVRIRVAGQNAANVYSRGELKVLAWALVLAQGACFRKTTPGTLLYLVDDLASELDSEHRARVCALLDVPGNQVLVTGIELNQLEQGWNAPKLFHVEHGSFRAEEKVDD